MNLHSNGQKDTALTPKERASLLAILGVFVMRMLGLFMLLPVLSLYASTLEGATPLLVGMAVGGYGISQALLQIPFGWASDRYGRRRLLVIGLVIFAVGSLVAALSTSVLGVILGRVLQGAGAISAVLTALLGDVIAETKRTRAMAVIGVGIGLSFMLSLVMGPLISAQIGVAGLFIVSTALALAALLITVLWLPNPSVSSHHRDYRLGPIFADRALRQLNLGIFALHFVLAALFVALPFVLRDQMDIAAASQWRVFGLALLFSIPGTVLLIRNVERSDHSQAMSASAQRVKSVAIALLLLVMITLSLAIEHIQSGAYWQIVMLVAVFFSAFNFLEARLPAQVSIAAGDHQRGAALGVYASSQFLGVFAGGAMAGIMMGWAGNRAVFALCSIVSFAWFAVHVLSAKQLGKF